jgi:hypothetical protein
MEPLAVVVLKVLAGAGSVGLSVYVLYRLVLVARKIGRTEAGAQIAGIFVLLFGPVVAPPPPREVATESREQDESGDPPIDPPIGNGSPTTPVRGPNAPTR